MHSSFWNWWSHVWRNSFLQKYVCGPLWLLWLTSNSHTPSKISPKPWPTGLKKAHKLQCNVGRVTSGKMQVNCFIYLFSGVLYGSYVFVWCVLLQSIEYKFGIEFNTKCKTLVTFLFLTHLCFWTKFIHHDTFYQDAQLNLIVFVFLMLFSQQVWPALFNPKDCNTSGFPAPHHFLI